MTDKINWVATFTQFNFLGMLVYAWFIISLLKHPVSYLSLLVGIFCTLMMILFAYFYNNFKVK